MKSKFAKFVDATLGSTLIFIAATAVLRYYTTLDIALFLAGSVTACAILLLKLKPKKQTDDKLEPAAADMFFEFSFMPSDAPAKRLYTALKQRYDGATRHGCGVYVNGVATYCLFSESADCATTARLIAKAKHYGAHTLLLLCKTPPDYPEITGITIKPVCGNAVYRLFGALGALPPRKYSDSRPKTPKAFAGALGKDKIIRYFILAASLGFMSWLTRSIIAFICAIACASLGLTALTMLAVKRIKTN